MWEQMKNFLDPVKILAVVGTILVLQKFMAEVFGITMLGKKIYKGAPGVWKRIMQGATERKLIHDKLDKIKAQVEFNGGQSLKDIVGRIENRQTTQMEILREVKAAQDFNTFRLELHDQSNDRMIFKLDKRGSCIFVNDAFLKFFGYTEKDILKFNYESVIHPEDIQQVRERIKRAIETRGDFYSEHRVGDVVGAYHNVVVRGYAIPDTTGEIQQFYGTVDRKE